MKWFRGILPAFYNLENPRIQRVFKGYNAGKRQVRIPLYNLRNVRFWEFGATGKLRLRPLFRVQQCFYAIRDFSLNLGQFYHCKGKDAEFIKIVSYNRTIPETLRPVLRYL
jgi:hypothetical protein